MATLYTEQQYRQALQMTALQLTEKAIRTGNYHLPVNRYRVYTIILEQICLLQGDDFRLYQSFDTQQAAKKCAKEVMKSGLSFAVVIDGGEDE